ncbi:uncharacterized protein LOC100824552 [Brachypodium distachyon]|uniref:WRC domain-containing protein n=1 Tax=Brachypodium distachyon TaxID=15368 RepID=I1GWQ4_BRADI|nr:uncharacterized protein LOC100824552 [Brachypodium distachyon]KQK17410.1 hypothetical protein BRADI_1g34290v3 [Brachypodium distachyon]|eukprot:XP_003560517.1 uncharacterized protein LOC100824552 [Brachypodium distachyon]
MRIRRCASRLVLGSAYDFAAAPDPAPRFELPPPPPARASPSADESHTGGGSFAAEAPSSGLLCELSLSPWDLMSQLDLSDPQEKEFFMLTYFVSVPFRASWLLPTNMPVSFIKEEVEEEQENAVAVDMVDGVNVTPPNKVAKKMAGKRILAKEDKNAREPRKKAKLKTEQDNGVAARQPELWTCKKNDGKRWFCPQPVNKPNSYCLYHTDRKRAAPPVSSAASKTFWSSKLRKKKAVVDTCEGFYYYAGFGPSRSKRHLAGSALQDMPLADEQQDQSPPTEQQEKAPAEDHAAPAPGEKAQTDAADYQAAAHIDEPKCDDMGWIAGCDEESSDDAFGFNGEPRVVSVHGDVKRKSPMKKRWRKPVKARSLKSLM